jgi:hypothetical protein
MSVVEMDNSLYTLGGFAHPRALNTVQRLSLDSLAWELMQLKLPQAALYFACINTDSQVYLLINESLYSFTPRSQGDQELLAKPGVTRVTTAEAVSTTRGRGTSRAWL